MKSLYESILDDEDILINDVKKDTDNPLIKIYSIYSNTQKLNSQLDKVEPIVREILDDIKLSKYFTRIRESSISVYKKALKPTEFDPSSLLFVIRFKADNYIEVHKAKCVMIEVGAQRLKKHVKALEEFAKKYNLEKSPLGNRHILW